MSAILGRLIGRAKASAEEARLEIQKVAEEKIGLAWYSVGERLVIRQENEKSVRFIYNQDNTVEKRFDELMGMVERNSDAIEARDDENLHKTIIALRLNNIHFQRDFLTLAYYDKLALENPSNMNSQVAANIREAISRRFASHAELWLTVIQISGHGKPEHVPDVLAVTKVPTPLLPDTRGRDIIDPDLKAAIIAASEKNANPND